MWSESSPAIASEAYFPSSAVVSVMVVLTKLPETLVVWLSSHTPLPCTGWMMWT